MATIEEARRRVVEIRRDKQRDLVVLRRAEGHLRRLRRMHGDAHPEVAKARAEVARRIAAARAMRDRERTVRAELADLIGASLAPDVGLDVRKLNGVYPIALLPVRIETRFLGSELRIRVYPDEILADMHDAALTEPERSAGEEYWRTAWDPAHELDAWKTLVGAHRSARAAWIVRATTPTNLGERPVGEPAFPAVDLRPDAWTRAVETRLLPDRWIALAHRGGAEIRRATSRPIVEPLALTFSPDAAEDELVEITDGLSIDADLAWTIEFDQAEEIGMAFRMPLDPADLDHGFDRLLVIGVKTSLAPERAAVELSALLDAHHYSRGLAFVRQGTPTNNTGATSSGYPPPEDPEHSFAVERGEPLPFEGTDGAVFARALGIGAEILAHVEGADRTEQRAGRAMNEALWPVTLGYFLEQIMSPGVHAADILVTRRHFVEHVRGRGPVPAFRVGGTPYGLLPVSSIAHWAPSPNASGLDVRLPDLLRRARPIWLEAAAQAPRVDRTDDPDADLLAVLGMDASAREARLREVIGPAYQANLHRLFGIDVPDATDLRSALTGAVLRALGLEDLQARLYELTFASEALRFRHPFVADEPLSEEAALPWNYIRLIREASIETLRFLALPRPRIDFNPLLFHLLRHAALVEYARVAVDLQVSHGIATDLDRREVELVGIVPGTERRPTVWQRFEQPIPVLTGDVPLGRFLLEAERPETEAVRAYREALRAIEDRSTAELERLLTETLDVCSHRLDAWITSLAARRLDEMRAAKPIGLHLGAFAWIENLRPRGRSRIEGGYIHAPSMAHAATAAVIRSAHLSRTGEARARFTIDLSSTRVRAALRLLDGVRQGQPLGALLGYSFERALHDRRLDRFIEDFRRLYPLAADPSAEPPAADEAIAARNVVDGLRLRTEWRDGRVPFGDLGLPADSADRQAVEDALRGLDAEVDAVADLLTAESIHQGIQGNLDAANAALDAAAGASRLPDPEVARMPRGGITCTHRVALVLGAPPSAPGPGWPTTPTPRAGAEPRLDAWLGTMLGDPNLVRCRVQYADPAPDDPGRARETVVTLADLDLRPLDILALARAIDSGAETELSQRVLRTRRDLIGDRAAEVVYDADPSWDPTSVRIFPDVLEVARAANETISVGRPLRPVDLMLPTAAAAAGSPDTTDLAARVDGTRVRLLASLDALASALEDVSIEAASLREHLWAATLFGIPLAVPAHDDLPALIEQGRQVVATMQRRLIDADVAPGPIEAIRAMLGPEFVALPLFQPSDPLELGQALRHGPALVGSPLEPFKWFQSAARVRDPLARLRRFALAAEALGAPPLELEVAQLPHFDDARWSALPFAADARPRPGTVSLVLSRLFDAPPEGAWAGLLLDEWVELIPSDRQNTAVAVYHDDPGAEAAQVVLLAVPPTSAPTWDLPTLVDILHESLDLAKTRAVDMDLLGFVALVLPTIYVAGNAADDTVSTDFVEMVVAEPMILSEEG